MERTYNPTEGVMIKNAQMKTTTALFELVEKFLVKAKTSNELAKKLASENRPSLCAEQSKVTDAYIDAATELLKEL